MLMLYNSDAFAVVRFDHEGASPRPADGASPSTADGASPSTAEGVATARLTTQPAAPTVRGFEIVDKRSRKEIFLSGLLAQSFQQGADALSETDPTPEQWDDYIEGFTALAQQPLVMH